MIQQSLPHAPTASPAYTTYTYDGIGRTVSVLAPDGSSTTTYGYQGNTVTVTDPAGKWKTFTMDAFGHLTQVAEPNPAGGSNYVTSYAYDAWDNVSQVSMPRPSGTQTRTFTYNGKLLMSATNPENGTVTLGPPSPSAAVLEMRQTPPSVRVPSTSIRKSLILRARPRTSGEARLGREISGMSQC
jgi:YD repeat-containing protein